MINEKDNEPKQTSSKRTEHPYFVWDSIQMIPQVLGQCLDDQVQCQAENIVNKIIEKKIDKLIFLGTGSSFFATIAEKYFFDETTPFLSWSFVTSVFKNYPPEFLDAKTAVFFHSHSGKTEGDDQVVEFAKSKGAFTIGVTDIAGSALAEVVDAVFIGPGGPKKEMPASRTYATAIFRMMILATKLGKALGKENHGKNFDQALNELPAMVKTFMQAYEPIANSNVSKLQDVKSFFCIGSGPNLSTADESALAFSQCAGVPAQSFELDNFIHGPLQTLTPGMGVVVIAAPGPLQDRLLRVARAAEIIGAKVVLVAPEDIQVEFSMDVIINMPAGLPELLTPVIYMVPLWQTAYHFGLLGRGGHPDRLSMDKPEFIEAFSYLMKKDKWVTKK